MVANSKNGAAIGAVAGGLAGVAGSYLAQEAIGRSLGKGHDKRSYKKMSDSDQKAANKALSKYRNMKTKEERLAWRKRIGSRV